MLVLDVEKTLPTRFQKKWAHITTETFTHFQTKNVYKRKSKKIDDNIESEEESEQLV